MVSLIEFIDIAPTLSDEKVDDDGSKGEPKE